MKALSPTLICVTTITAITLIVVAFLEIIQNPCSSSADGEVSTLRITSFISIANALLLFVTLLYNSNAIGIQNNNFFETTFFNLLKVHQRLADEIYVYRSTVNTNNVAQVDELLYKGRDFFSLAIKDLYYIFENLYKKDITYYDIETAQRHEALLADNTKRMDASVSNTSERYKIIDEQRAAMVNTFYNITNEDKKTNKEKGPMTFKIFERKMKPYYELYERNITYLLDYIKDNGKDKDKYVDIFLSQVTTDEYRFLNNLCSSNKRLQFLMLDMNIIKKFDKINELPPNYKFKTSGRFQ